MKKLYLVLITLMAVSAGSFAQTTIFFDNMSSFPTGWTLSPATGWVYHSGSYSAQGDEVSPYANNQNNYMTRAVNLSGYTSATLTFDVWQYTEAGYDYLYAQYYSGSTWTMVWSRAGDYRSWSQQTVAIPTSTTQIRFWFKSDGSVTRSGAWIDNVKLTATGSTVTYSISGTVSGATASGVTMTLSGTGTGTQTTDGSGNYTFSGLVNGSYTVTPSKSGYTFSPTSTAVTISGTNQTGKNFTATSTATYSISGTVSGATASGVTMTLSGAGSGTQTTDGSGNYTFSGLANGSYTVTPSKSGYAFSPTATAVSISGASQSGKNFTATVASTTAWNFVHITDIHVDTTNADVNGQSFGNMMAKIRTLSPAPAFVIASGDLVDHALKGNDGVVDSANWRCLTRKMVKVGNTWYVPNSSGGSTGIPIYFTPGNHDDRNEIFPKWTNKNLNGYDQYIGYKSGTPPVSPTGVACTFGSGDAARDYYFTYNNAVIVSMYSGTDQGVDVINPSSYGMTNSKLALLSQALRNNIAAPVKIVFMHNPAADANGTDITGGQNYTKVWSVADGCIYYGRTAFCDTLDACRITMSGTTYWPVAFHGHVEQKVVCDRNGTIRDRNWTGGVRYIQTDACKDGAYRIINVTNANPSFATAEEQTINPTIPSVRIINPMGGTLAPGNALLTVDVGAWDANMINNVEVSVNGTPVQTLISPPYATNVTIPEANQNCMITAKAFDKLGNSNTASVTINKGISTNTYYDRMTVGSTVPVNCPKCKGVMTVKLNEIRFNPRQADLTASGCACGSKSPLLEAKQADRLSGTGTEPGLFAYVNYISNVVGSEFVEIMIAPYQYPSVDIVAPIAGQQTNICEVKLATNYSGKGVPWTNANGLVGGTDNLKDMTYTYNGSSTTQKSENYIWNMSSGADPRTLTVKIKDVFGTEVSRSVSVTYNPSLQFLVYRGEFGDSWKNKSLSFSLYPNSSSSYKTIVKYDYWDVSTNKWGGSSAAASRDQEISEIASSMISFPLGQDIPGGSLPIYVANNTEYTSGTLNDGYWGVITYKEIYDELARQLGRDNNGKYRVWISASAATRSAADAIADVEPPVVSITGPANYSIVSPGASVAVSASAADESGITKVEFYVDNVLKGTDNGAPYTCTWTAPAAIEYDKDYAITAKAYGGDARTTVSAPVELTVAGTLSNPFINGGFESHGGWITLTNNSYYTTINLKSTGAYAGNYCGRIYIGIANSWGAMYASLRQIINIPLSATKISYYEKYRFVHFGGHASYNITLGAVTLESAVCDPSSEGIPIYTGGTNPPSWVYREFDVPASLKGQNNVEFKVTVNGGSENVGEYEDFYLDNVKIATQAVTYSISGTVSGATGSGVTITMSGAATGSTTTDGSGNYTFSGLANGSYTVAPSKSGYTFSPTSTSVTISGTSQGGKNFTATAVPTYYSISGIVSGASGVTLTLTGAGSGNTTTDVSGNYAFGGLANGSYTVTPSKSGYSFSPASTTVTISGANQTGKNFTATAITYSITGNVSGATASGVTINLSGAGSGNTTTDVSGNYAFGGLANGSYTVTPSKSGYVFSPASTAVTISGASQGGKNFTATALPPATAPGLISPDNYATVTATPTLSWYAVSGATEYYVAIYTVAYEFKQGAFTGSTSWTVPEALSSADYYWYVWAHNSAGYGPPSIERRFTVTAPAPPRAPLLASPYNYQQNVSTTPTLTWNAVDGPVDLYYVVILNNNNEIVDNTITSSTSWSVATALPRFAWYTWYVRAHNSVGWSLSSEYWHFMTNSGAKGGDAVAVDTTDQSSFTLRLINIKTAEGSYAGDYWPVAGVNKNASQATVIKRIKVPFNATSLKYDVTGWKEIQGMQLVYKLGSQECNLAAYRGQTVDIEITLFDACADWPGEGAHGAFIGSNNLRIITDDIEVKRALPAATQLLTCAPNPLNQHTKISYQLESAANVLLQVYNISGQLVKTLVDAQKPAGYHSVGWDSRDANGSKVAAGVYLYRMSAGDYSKTNKLTVLR